MGKSTYHNLDTFIQQSRFLTIKFELILQIFNFKIFQILDLKEILFLRKRYQKP